MSSFEHMFDLQELHINHANMITEIICYSLPRIEMSNFASITYHVYTCMLY